MSHSKSNTYEHNREGFTGIWIPAELFHRKDLTPLEMIFLGWIHSLEKNERGACYASNAFLSTKMKVTEKYISDIIAKLIKLKLIERINFNGRERLIKTCPQNWYNSDSESEPIRKQTPEKSGSRVRKNPHPTYIENKEEKQQQQQEEVVVVVHKDLKKQANHLKTHLEGFSSKNDCNWKISLESLEKLISKFGIEKIAPFVNYMLDQHIQALKDEEAPYKKKKTSRIDNPLGFLRKACSEDWVI